MNAPTCSAPDPGSSPVAYSARPPLAHRERWAIRQARRIEELIQIAALRHAVFVGEKGYARKPGFRVPCFIDALDMLPTTINLFAEQDGRVVGCVRLLTPNPEIARLNDVRYGLDIEQKYRIHAPASAHLGEATRFCLDPARRGGGLYPALRRAIRRSGREHGLTHVLGVADLETDSAADAFEVYSNESARGHVDKAFEVEVLPVAGEPPINPTRPLSRRDGHIETGGTLRTFLRSRARIIGPPKFDPMGTFAVPVAHDLRR